jgi:glucose-6-phosphate isomerase
MGQAEIVKKILEDHIKVGLMTEKQYGEEPLLSTENIKVEAIGRRLGLSPNEINELSPRLKEIHDELSKKLSQPDLLKQEMMAWMTLWNQDSAYLQKIQSYADEIRKDYTEFLVIGIGGSSLGAKALLHALNYIDQKPHTPRIFFLENADAETLGLFENRLKESYGKADYSRVAVNVISKSGTTAETSANFEVVLQHMKAS